VGGGDLVVVDLGLHPREEGRVPDGDAARHPDAVHRERDAEGIARAVRAHHSPSPNLSVNSASISPMAASSSGPSVSRSTVGPMPAGGILTPMMLFAFTRRPLRVSQMVLSNLEAAWVSLAEARACSPSLLLTLMVRL